MERTKPPDKYLPGMKGGMLQRERGQPEAEDMGSQCHPSYRDLAASYFSFFKDVKMLKIFFSNSLHGAASVLNGRDLSDQVLRNGTNANKVEANIVFLFSLKGQTQ